MWTVLWTRNGIDHWDRLSSKDDVAELVEKLGTRNVSPEDILVFPPQTEQYDGKTALEALGDTRIAVIVEGGIVQEVIANREAAVTVVDYDTDVAESDDLKIVNGRKAYIYIGITSTDVNLEKLDRIVKEANQQS